MSTQDIASIASATIALLALLGTISIFLWQRHESRLRDAKEDALKKEHLAKWQELNAALGNAVARAELANKISEDANSISRRAVEESQRANQLAQRALDAEEQKNAIRIDLDARAGRSVVNASVGNFGILLTICNNSQVSIEIQELCFEIADGTKYHQACTIRGLSDSVNENARSEGSPERLPGTLRAGGRIEVDMSGRKIGKSSIGISNPIRYDDPRLQNVIGVGIHVNNQWKKFDAPKLLSLIRSCINNGRITQLARTGRNGPPEVQSHSEPPSSASPGRAS